MGAGIGQIQVGNTSALSGPVGSAGESGEVQHVTVSSQGDVATFKTGMQSPLLQAQSMAEEVAANAKSLSGLDVESEEEFDKKLDEELRRKLEQVPDLPPLENVKNFLKDAARYKGASPEDLRRLASEYSRDPGHQDELLDLLAQFKKGDQEFQKQIHEAREGLDQTAVQITKNVTRSLHDRGFNDDEKQYARDFMGDTLVAILDPLNMSSVQRAVSEISTRASSPEDAYRVVDSVMAGASAEMAAESHAMDHAQLSHFIKTMQGGKVIKTFVELSAMTVDKLERIARSSPY
ncbi:HrpJ domain-containing protein [Endozoicomonadaceae bacterium StTr2]